MAVLFLMVFVILCCVFFFFFQAEDGIRDLTVTGVQTCALPICAATATGLASRGLVKLRATRSRSSSATSRLWSGSGAQERPPRDAAGERRRKRRVRLLEGAAGDAQARSAAAHSPAPPASARRISSRPRPS